MYPLVMNIWKIIYLFNCWCKLKAIKIFFLSINAN